jgi:DNA-binding HxlR family transcriptional regulator
MTVLSRDSSTKLMAIIVELMLSGPLRVEELRQRCENVSKRTFYLELKRAEKMGLLVRIRKSRKNVVVQLNPKNYEARKAKETYDSLQRILNEYYSKRELDLRNSLQAAYQSRDRKKLRQMVFKQAWFLAVSSVAFVLLEGRNVGRPSDSFFLRFQQEIDTYLILRNKKMIYESIRAYGKDVTDALEEWLAAHAKEIVP